MTKAERTRQFIIEKTAPVFNMNGFEGTSLADLQAATGLTKGSLYGNFSDKEEMALAAFQYAIREVKSAIQNHLCKKETARDKLMAMVLFFGRYVFHPPIQGGCPLLNNAIEADDHHVSMKEVVSLEIENVIRFISGLIEEGKRNCEFRRDVKSRELAYVFFSAIEGAIMISRVSSSDVAMKAVINHIRILLNQIKNK
ncbi:MAG TPA: TetR/AcrR family transcriptional regulator [Ohtaekwangia sp.]|nr:TetR/AcrR family transcriptional regulator [Ohtaekwangia sp.]